ncbi:MAG: sulfite exporter TauE/SafE family protein [Flammeovirgaceae bacterium]|nr:sulfite exporter TauE/SafE family protein [Flammeovirgaceae bacterium]
MEFVIFFLLTLFAEILGTIGGFGSSLFFVSFLQFLYDFQTVLALTGILHVFSNSAKLILFWKTIDWKLVLWLGVSSVVLAIGGAILTRYVEFEYAKILLGIFLIVFPIWMLARPKDQVKPTVANSIVGGGIAGFLAGFIGTGGAIRGLILAAFNLEKNFLVGTSAAIDFGVDLSRSIIYVDSGFLRPTYIAYIPMLIIGAFLGSYIGKVLLKKSVRRIFENHLSFVLLVGISLLVKEADVIAAIFV